MEKPTTQDYIFASGTFLMELLPDNFQDLTDDDLYEFIADNLWEPFQDYPAQEVWRFIEDLARSIAYYYTSIGKS